MKRRIWVAITSLMLLAGALPMVVNADTPKVVISQVKIGGAVSGEPTEFVSIYNSSTQAIDLSGWTLEYAKPAAKIGDCSALNWKAVDSSSNVKELGLQGVVAPQSAVLVELSMTDNSGGSLRLSAPGVTYDLVGWGNLVSHSVCSEADQAPIPASTKSISRHFGSDGQIVDEDNNLKDFTDPQAQITPTPSVPDPAQNPGGSNDACPNIDDTQLSVPVGYGLTDGACVQVPALPEEACIGVSISEILPNPSGSDTGAEYVELHNSTDETVDLTGCSLVVGNSHKDLTGPIQPGYQAFFGLTLPNAAGGSVAFITPTTEDVVNYPADLSDDTAYALIDGEWQVTNQPTPNSANIESIETVTVSTTSTNALAACPVGKYRNPATNRCKTIESPAGLKPCDPGQFRNPETNRCKSLASTVASLKPCDPGQERNPATNRCRKIAAATALKACQEGQERNPETNRCRKVAGVQTASANNASPESATPKPTLSLVAFAAVAVFALGYGVYEYRDSIGDFFVRMRSSLKK